MARPYHCVLISVCLAGALLLLPLCLGVEDYQYDYDSTPTSEYDYNSTFEYLFFSNVSSEVLDKFLMGEEMDSGGEKSFTEIKEETDGDVPKENPTDPTIFYTDQASQSTPVCSLLSLVLMVQQLLRLL